MAMTSAVRKPVLARSKEMVAQRSSEALLKLVPDVSNGARATHRYFATFLSVVSVLGLLVLLFVNTLLAQDAFTLSNLKADAKAVADQREAIARSMDEVSSPAALAAAAAALGMKPSQSPVFLNLAPELDGQVDNG
jgi:hypothetical protein